MSQEVTPGSGARTLVSHYVLVGKSLEPGPDLCFPRSPGCTRGDRPAPGNQDLSSLRLTLVLDQSWLTTGLMGVDVFGTKCPALFDRARDRYSATALALPPDNTTPDSYRPSVRAAALGSLRELSSCHRGHHRHRCFCFQGDLYQRIPPREAEMES